VRAITSARLACTAVIAVALASLGFVAGASAHTGEFSRFDNCPSTNTEVFKCIQSITTGGKVVLGKKTVPIVNPVTLQGGFTRAPKAENFIAKFVGATNGETLSKTPQPVPGGLAGLVNCKEISSFLVRVGCETIFENGLTGVNATLELAKPASEIRISEVNLINQSGSALVMPVKVHLENPLLGSSCYVGSSSSPLIWNLTTGTTEPPAGTAPITGEPGTLEFLEEGLIVEISPTKLVDNTWSAPHASGCGGPIVELILDPIIDSQIGTPSPAGANVAELITSNYIALASQVNAH
jgi:hypothetical protein